MNIIESNKLIAEFMGIEPFSEIGQYEAKDIIIALDMTMNPCIHFNSFLDVVYIDDFRFHESWDWLMPVVEKIESLGYNVKIYTWAKGTVHSCSIEGVSIDYNGDSKLRLVYESIIEFIKWYNDNK